MILVKALTGVNSSPFRRTVSILSRLKAVSHLARQHQSACFGLPGLYEPDDWRKITASCIDDCVVMANSLRRMRSSPSVSILQKFDDLSDRLCRVLDVAELCRNVHPDPGFVTAANDSYLELSSVVQELNADMSIYEPLRALHDENQRRVTLGLPLLFDPGSEDSIMLHSLKTDFERGGIHLPDDKKKRFLKLQDKATSLSASFSSTAAEVPATIELHESKVQHLPQSLRRSLNPSNAQQGYVSLPLTSSNSHLILKWVRDGNIREKVFRLVNGADTSKIETLDNLLSCRHEIAGLLGHNSYAELLFNGRLASSPTDVLRFLNDLSQSVWDGALMDRNSIEVAKLKLEPCLHQDGNATVSGWDRSFFIGRLKAQDYSISSTEVSHYFPLSVCLRALSEILHDIFGMRLIRVDAPYGELWHDDVDKFAVEDEQGQLIGHIFLDLFPRDGKYGHAAHFAISCGRQIPESGDYRTPAVALVCNFHRDSQTGTRLLTISEYETLFHEFGHSLHSLLSRTKYQHLSGTRVATDFVEVPSHIFEHFAWDERVIARFARHYKTGDPMPTRTVRALCASRTGFASTDVQMQALFSAMDLSFHGQKPRVGETTAAFEELQRKMTVYEPDKGVPVPANFHHFVGYGAGYYSYIFARIISAQIWADLFDKDPFSRVGGARLQHGMLEFGGACDPASLMKNVGCGRVSCTPFLKKMGLDSRKPLIDLTLPIAQSASSESLR